MKIKIILSGFLLSAVTLKILGFQQPPSLEASAFAKALGQEMPSQLCSQTMRYALEKNTVQAVQAALDQRRGAPSTTKHFRDSFMEFICRVYNHEQYTQVLSQDGSDLVQFLDLTKEAGLEPQDAYVGLRLFCNKLKACEIVDDSMLEQVLSALAQNMPRYFIEGSKVDAAGVDFIKKNIENIILMQLTSHLDQFQKNPDIFVSDVSDQIASELHKHWKSSQKKAAVTIEAKERLRMLTGKLLEITLGKLVWSQQLPEMIWASFLNLANKLQMLGANKVIDHMDDLDDLLWTLTHRFCFFLDLTNGTLPLSFFDTVEQQLANKTVYFLEMAEQDKGITSKKETIIAALIKGRMHALTPDRKNVAA